MTQYPWSSSQVHTGCWPLWWTNISRISLFLFHHYQVSMPASPSLTSNDYSSPFSMRFKVSVLLSLCGKESGGCSVGHGNGVSKLVRCQISKSCYNSTIWIVRKNLFSLAIQRQAFTLHRRLCSPSTTLTHKPEHTSVLVWSESQ